MDICHEHNLIGEPAARAQKRYGVRVSLPPRDSFARLIGREWERFHWFPTMAERDRALRDMASEHLYSRRGDRPTLVFEPVEKPADA